MTDFRTRLRGKLLMNLTSVYTVHHLPFLAGSVMVARVLTDSKFGDDWRVPFKVSDHCAGIYERDEANGMYWTRRRTVTELMTVAEDHPHLLRDLRRYVLEGQR